MKASWHLGRIAGIDVYMHLTFLILIGWVGISHYLPRRSWADAWSGILFILMIFAIVVLHELGHALTARRFGIRTRDITLWPIGGVARLERMPENPIQELLVAVAGPAVNVALAIALALLIAGAGGSPSVEDFDLVGGSFLAKLLWVNVALAVFNMIPAFPMDGGRALRAVLAMRMDYVRATQIAASIGQGIAFLFGFVGLFYNPFLVFIALFVWMGASGEASMVQLKSALGGIPITRAMITDFKVLGPGDTLAHVVQHLLSGFQQDFPVVDGDKLVGVLSRSELVKVLGREGEDTPVWSVMNRNFETAEPSEMLEHALLRLQTCECHSLPVVRNGQVVGMLTMDNVGEFLMIQAALQGAPSTRLRHAAAPGAAR